MITRRAALLAAAAIGLSLVAGPALPAAAEVVVTPNVPALPVGGAPALPYVDVQGQRIVDGSRRVSLAGMQGTAIRLYKVDGGYVLGRAVGDRWDLVFVTRSGNRALITRYWDAPNPFTMEPGVIVGPGGDRMVFNRKRVDTTDPQDYLDTMVVSLPERRILHRRTFSWPPTLMADAGNRVLISLPFGRTLWWTPGVFSVETVSSDAVGQAADLSADQYAANTSASRVVVRAIAPGAPAAFDVEADQVLGFWSLDDDMIAGTGEVMDDGWATAHLVWQASNGTPVLTILREGPPRITWESNTSVLVLAAGTVGTGYQWIRCSLTGTCQRVGPPSSSPYGSLVPATRRSA